MTTPQKQAADIEGSHVEPPTFVTSEPVTQEPASRTESFFTTEQLEKARAEERQKVQSEKARLKAKYDAQVAELEELKAAQAKVDAERAAEEKKRAKAKRQEDEKDLSAKEILARREAEWEARLQEQEQRFVQMEARARLEQEAMKLQVYIQRRVAEEQSAKTIAPQFVDYITGTSVDEVELAIELAKQKTAEILAEVTNAAPPPRAQGVSPHSGPANIGSVTETQGDEVDYTNMSLSTYLEKVRPKLNIGGGGQGLFQ